MAAARTATAAAAAWEMVANSIGEISSQQGRNPREYDKYTRIINAVVLVWTNAKKKKIVQIFHTVRYRIRVRNEYCMFYVLL